MRGRWSGSAGVFVVATLLVTLSGCGAGAAHTQASGSSITSGARAAETAPGGSVRNGGSGTSSSSASTTSTTVPLPHNPLGTALVITGPNGEAATVVVQQVVASAAPVYPFLVPPAGQEYVAVKLAVTNTGPAVLTDDADADTTTRDGAGHTFHAVSVAVNGCPGFAGGLFTLAPAMSATGCVTFEVPAGFSARAVTFGLGGSNATSVASWRVS